MSNNSYVPPHMRNKTATEQTAPTERKNPFQKERRAPRRPHEKPFWQIQQEKEQLEAEEKKRQAEKGLEDTIENFPALGASVAKTGSIWSSGRKFSELATDWKAADDKRKEDDQHEKNRTDNSLHDDVFQLPRFRNMHRFSEPEDGYYEEEAAPEEQVPPEEKWTVVSNRKYRKPKPEFDFNEDDFNDEDEEEDTTVWGAPEEHETCWDERRH